MTADRVIEVPDPEWGFDDQGPKVKVGSGPYKRMEKVDPAPAYGHDPKLVAEVLAHCERLAPVKYPPTVFLLRHELVGRTNGWTGFDNDYNFPKDWAGRTPPSFPYITLSGKRIPIHPAITRYLVAHEYGHVVDNLVAWNRFNGSDPGREQDEEYSKLRGLTAPAYYGPGTWHCSVSELVANDFRILVCGIEREYWPHPGIARPEEIPAVKEWWNARLREPFKEAVLPTSVPAP